MSLTLWMRVYQMIGSKDQLVPENIIKEAMDICTKNLPNVLQLFKTYTIDSFEDWKITYPIKEIVNDHQMCNFVHTLSRRLNLSTDQTWDTICNFLVYEYHGKRDDLKNIIRFHSKLDLFIERIWDFHSLERRFLLQTLRYVLENLDNKSIRHHTKFQDFLEKIDISHLWKKSVESFQALTTEINRDNARFLPDHLLKNWINRNNREQVELVFILIDLLAHYKLESGDFETVFSICVRHFFGRAPLFSEAYKISSHEDLLEVRYAEYVLVLCLFEKVWKSSEILKKFEEPVEEMLDFLKKTGNDNIIFFTWSLFKATTRDHVAIERRFIYIDMEVTLKKKPFRILNKIVEHTMFEGTKVAYIMADAVNFLLTQFAQARNDFQFLYEQEGIPEIVALLIKLKGPDNIEIFQPLYETALNSFPQIYKPFLEISKSLLSIPSRYDTILLVMKNLPTFLSDSRWITDGDITLLDEELQLFTDSNLFMIPAGTIIERYKCRDEDYVQFKYSYSFFLLLEQYIISLNSIRFGIVSEGLFANIKRLVLGGYQFIHHYLKEYKGDYYKDIELKTLVSRLNVIPVQFCEGEKMDYDFAILYFSINSTLIRRDFIDYLAAFPIDIRKRFMPVLERYDKNHKGSLFNQLSGSYLVQALKEEEFKHGHCLLLEYLQFLHYMVKNNRYALEVQIPGLWITIYSPFLFIGTWTFKDRTEKITIIQLCCSIIVEVLQRQFISSGEEPDIVCEYVVDTFFTDHTLPACLLSVISKERAIFQDAMFRETNWVDSGGDEYIECIRLHILLAFLLYKHKAVVKHKINYLDEHVGDFAKAIISYIFNPFSLSLRMLSCKFLEITAKDSSVPLLSVLGLDVDQVQRIFLERLRDPTENENFKCLLLDFIGTCLFNQGAMTAAFFSFKRTKKWYSESTGDEITLGPSVKDFIVESLLNLKNIQDPKVLRSPLQIGILHIMANLWITSKLILIEDSIKLPQFWGLLTCPLYKEFVQSFKIYGYIFRILSIQLVQSVDRTRETAGSGVQLIADQKIFHCVQRFLNSKDHFENWTTFFFDTFKKCSISEEAIQDRHYFLKAWMEFFVVLQRKHELPKLDKAQRQTFLNKSLEAVQFSIVNNYCLKLWMDFLIIQFVFWKENETEDFPLDVLQAIDVISMITIRYRYEPHATRVSILSVIKKIFELIRKELETSTHIFIRALERMGPVVDMEYTVMRECEWKNEDVLPDTVTREVLLPWLLCVTIVNKFFLYPNIKEVSYWFSYRDLITKYTNCIAEFLKHRAAIPFVKVMIHGLILYANSEVGFDFITFDFSKFFMSIEKNIYKLMYGDTDQAGVNPVLVEEGWSTMSLFVLLITTLSKKLQQLVISNVYIFLNLAEKLFEYILGMAGTTVALRALDLIISILMLFDTLQGNWSYHWYTKDNESYTYLMTGVKKIINGCLYAILRPKNIIVYAEDFWHRVCLCDTVPSELMIAIVNRLITAVGLGCSILYRVNGGLTELTSQVLQSKVQVLIENDFNVPKFELPVTSNLTYGMLLCLAHFLCKTLEGIRHQGVPEDSGGTENTSTSFFTRVYGMVQHEGFSDSYPTQQLSAFLRYAMYEYTGLADPWTLKLDYTRVKMTLESLMMFLGQQIFLTLNIAPFDNETYLKFKKNLESELQFFYEHVKKITSLMLTESNATPVGQFEMDVLKKFFFYSEQTGQYDKIIDTNFCVVLSTWFGISQLK